MGQAPGGGIATMGMGGTAGACSGAGVVGAGARSGVDFLERRGGSGSGE